MTLRFDAPTDHRAARPICIRDRVRSHDFADGTGWGFDLEGERCSFVEGTVERFFATGEHESLELSSCERVAIRVDLVVRGGKVVSDHPLEGELVFPRANGVPIWGGERVTDGLVRLGDPRVPCTCHAGDACDRPGHFRAIDAR